MAIDGSKLFFLIEKGKAEVENYAKKFTPAKYLDIMSISEDLEPLGSIWLALVEYVTNYFREQIVDNLSYLTQPDPAQSIA